MTPDQIADRIQRTLSDNGVASERPPEAPTTVRVGLRSLWGQVGSDGKLYLQGVDERQPPDRAWPTPHAMTVEKPDDPEAVRIGILRLWAGHANLPG